MTYININWMDFSLCRGKGYLFFPPSNVTGRKRAKLTQQALEICGQCPVAEPCRDYGVATQSSGIWGGETDEQRAVRGLPVTVDVMRRVKRQQQKESVVD
jgi:WhiB family redox-sensing transcriptional regulator